jgi:hypothetical protein
MEDQNMPMDGEEKKEEMPEGGEMPAEGGEDNNSDNAGM